MIEKTITAVDIAGLLSLIAKGLDENRDMLCQLDGVIGDADHGITMALGFGTVRDHLAGLDVGALSPTEIFNTTAKVFLNATGASAGPLYATAFMRAGAHIKGKSELTISDFAALIAVMAKGIADRGKAALGDKTMLEAWLPAGVAADAALSLGQSGEAALLAAAKAAQEGAEASAALMPKIGRSARLGERAIGHRDPGAVSAAMIIGWMAEYFQSP